MYFLIEIGLKIVKHAKKVALY